MTRHAYAHSFGTRRCNGTSLLHRTSLGALSVKGIPTIGLPVTEGGLIFRKVPKSQRHAWSPWPFPFPRRRGGTCAPTIAVLSWEYAVQGRRHWRRGQNQEDNQEEDDSNEEEQEEEAEEKDEDEEEARCTCRGRLPPARDALGPAFWSPVKPAWHISIPCERNERSDGSLRRNSPEALQGETKTGAGAENMHSCFWGGSHLYSDDRLLRICIVIGQLFMIWSICVWPYRSIYMCGYTYRWLRIYLYMCTAVYKWLYIWLFMAT